MAASYLVLAVVLAVALNHRNRFVRAAGSLIAALGLAMIAVSIVLADFDGTFAAAPGSGVSAFNPLILNVQAAVAAVAAAFLVWTAWLQTMREEIQPVALRNAKAGFGLVSRYAHWITATLMLCLIPIGLFVAVLPAAAPDRAEFLAAHQSLGLLLLPIAAARLAWLAASPPPPAAGIKPYERRLARTVHAGLYGLILGFPLTGLMMTLDRGEAISFFGLPVGRLVAPDEQAARLWQTGHDAILPLAFYVLIFAHVGAVLKHHFADGRRNDVRRMLA